MQGTKERARRQRLIPCFLVWQISNVTTLNREERLCGRKPNGFCYRDPHLLICNICKQSDIGAIDYVSVWDLENKRMGLGPCN